MLFGSKEKNIERAVAKKNSKAVIELFGDKDDHIRHLAFEAAGQIGDDDCMNALVPYLHHANATVRADAALGLGAIGNPHAAAFISYQLDHEEDPTVRAALTKGMQKLHGEE